MKKLLSVFLIIITIISVYSLPVSAVFNDTSDYKYFSEYVEYNGKDCCEGYYELYYHYSDDSEEPDWTLIYSRCMPYYDIMKFGMVIEDIVLWDWGINDPHFPIGFGVYVSELNTFIEVSRYYIDEIIEYCPDFVDVLEKCGYGTQFGDVNYDKKLDIVDVTYIQRMIAGYNDIIYSPLYPVPGFDIGSTWSILDAEYVSNVGRISDYDRDGETTVMDATAIQRHLAGLE